MDDERCDCLFSRSKPQFLGVVNVGSGMHSHAGAWERGMGSCHSREDLPVIPAKISPSFPRMISPSFPQNTPSFPQNTPSFPQNSQSFPQNSPSFPQNSPSFPQNSPSFPRRRESITERPILNELARRGLYAFPRGSVGTREKSPDWRGYNLGMSLLFLLFPQISHPWQPGRP